MRLANPLTLCGLLIVVMAVQHSSHLDLLAPFGLLALVLGSGARSAAAAWLFGGAATVFLGEVSYSLYLIHVGLFELLYLPGVMPVVLSLSVWGKAGIGILVWLVLVLLSWVGYRSVEQPFRAFGSSAIRHALAVRGRW